MKTNFFENIANLQVPGNWKIAIHADSKGTMTVSALLVWQPARQTAPRSARTGKEAMRLFEKELSRFEETGAWISVTAITGFAFPIRYISFV